MADTPPIDNSPGMLSPEMRRLYQASVLAERKPIEQLQTRKKEIDQKASLLGDLITKVDSVRMLLPGMATPSGLRELAFRSADERIVTGAIEKDLATPGVHNLEVISLANRGSALSNGFPDRDETSVGTGYFTFRTPRGEEKEVFIDEQNSTLDGLAKVINSANIGIHASVSQDSSDPDAPWHLLLTSENTGAGQSVEYPEFYFIDGDSDFFIEQERDSSNARVRFEGFEVEYPTNEIKDLIQGVNLTLNGADPGRPVNLTVEQDTKKTVGRIKDLVDKMNAVFSFIQTQNTMDENTNTKQTLGGEYSIRMTEDRFRNALQGSYIAEPGRQIRGLSDLGIEFTKKGVLQLDEKKLEGVIKNHFEDVTDFLVGDGETTGVVARLRNSIGTITGGDGALLTNQKKNLGSQIKKISSDIERKEKLVEQKTQTLKLKLGKVQGALTAMQNQGAMLASQQQVPTFFPNSNQ